MKTLTSSLRLVAVGALLATSVLLAGCGGPDQVTRTTTERTTSVQPPPVTTQTTTTTVEHASP